MGLRMIETGLGSPGVRMDGSLGKGWSQQQLHNPAELKTTRGDSIPPTYFPWPFLGLLFLLSVLF